MHSVDKVPVKFQVRAIYTEGAKNRRSSQTNERWQRHRRGIKPQPIGLKLFLGVDTIFSNLSSNVHDFSMPSLIYRRLQNLPAK